jgi:hypothetical protein
MITVFIIFEVVSFSFNVLRDTQVLINLGDTKTILLYLDLATSLTSVTIMMIVSIVFIKNVVFYIQTRKLQSNKKALARSKFIEVEEREEEEDFKYFMSCKCLKNMTFKQKSVIWYIIVAWLFFLSL